MAENETLDLGNIRNDMWRKLLDSTRTGKSVTEVADIDAGLKAGRHWARWHGPIPSSSVRSVA
jgi:hypothetical protein